MGRVSGKVVLVTGGGSGIGRASAELLAREGATVVVSDIDAQGGAETATRIGGAASFLPHDTSSEADWQRVLGAIQDRHGALHGLVNNAGISGRFPSGFEYETVDDWRRIFAVNVEGVFLGCRLAVPVMRESGGGSIVNLSSLAALVGTPELSAYGASKGAVRQFTKSVALACARKGYKVRCNSVHPGIILTAMGEGLLRDPDARKQIQSRIPLGEFGQAEDIAYGVLYLISDESRHMTGGELVIDGGIAAA